MVSTHLKNISQIGSFPQVGVSIKIFETTTQICVVPRLSFMKSTGFRFQNSTNSTNHEQGLKLALMSSVSVAVLRPLKVGWPGSHAEMYMESPLESQPVGSGCQWLGGIFCGWFIYTLLNSDRPRKKPPCWWYLLGKDRFTRKTGCIWSQSHLF